MADDRSAGSAADDRIFDRGQHSVPGSVTVPIVEGPETIDVDDRDSDRKVGVELIDSVPEADQVEYPGAEGVRHMRMDCIYVQRVVKMSICATRSGGGSTIPLRG